VELPIDPFARHCLLNGIDELGYIRQQEDAIAAFEARRGCAVNTPGWRRGRGLARRRQRGLGAGARQHGYKCRRELVAAAMPLCVRHRGGSIWIAKR
jgi:hypothetical protein